MSDDIVRLVKEHRAFYEVLPHYVVVEERHGSLEATTRTLKGGFDVDIYGAGILISLPARRKNTRLRKSSNAGTKHLLLICMFQHGP